MRRVYTAILLAVLVLGLCSCSQDASPSPTPTPVSANVQPSSSAESGEPTQSAPPATAAETETPKQSEAAIVDISGINADNYPYIDASTANMPLLAALYSRVCGVTLEEAETMIETSGGTGAVWRGVEFGTELVIAYEAPESVKAELKDSGLWDGLDIRPIGRDALVFLANKSNPVESLSQDQLVDIYTGKTADWADVGGESGPITAFQRNDESGSQTLFKQLLMKDTPPTDAPNELRPGMMGGLIDAVASYDGSGGAIGFSVYYYANLMYSNPSLKLLAVDGVAPSDKSIADGSYPLTNEFYVAINDSEPEGSPARLLRDWLLSGEGKELLREANYVAVE